MGLKKFIEQSKLNINKSNGNLLFFVFVLLSLIIIFSYTMGNVSAVSGDTIYVNGSSRTISTTVTHGPRQN